MVRCTVITPCFDDGAYLPELRESLRRGERVHHVIVDDGSTDARTLEVLAELDRDPDVTVLRTSNGGPAAARNLAIRAATTPYVMCIDADDIALPGAVRDLADALDADPALSVVWGDGLRFGAQFAHQPLADELDPWWFTYVNEVVVGLMGRTEDLRAAGWDETSGYEDWGTTLALISKDAQGRNIGRAAYGYRSHATGRRLATTDEKDEAEIANLRSRYPGPFARRSLERRRSSAPRSVRLVGTVVSRVPGLSRSREHRIVNRLAAYLWPRRWIHHPAELPRHPLSRHLPGRKTVHHSGRLVAGLRSVVPNAQDVALVVCDRDDDVLSAFGILEDRELDVTTIDVAAVASPDHGAGSPVGERVRTALDSWSRECAPPRVVVVPAGAGSRTGRHRAAIGWMSRILGTSHLPVAPDAAAVRDAVTAWARTNPDAVVVLYDEFPRHWARSGLDAVEECSVFHIPVDTTAQLDRLRQRGVDLRSVLLPGQLEQPARGLPAAESFAVVRGSWSQEHVDAAD